MTQSVYLWRIKEDTRLAELHRSELDLESRLEDWLETDIGILDDSLFLIGRQVETDFGGTIDLLCVDAAGDLVVVELKRGKTPRDIIGQILDYAAWVDGLSYERIDAIAGQYLRRPFDEAFLERFGAELPESINAAHRMVVVAAEIDPSSERIIEYLSNRHGVSINAVTFQYFRDGSGGEFLARVFLLEPDEVDYRAKTKSDSKRKPNLTREQLQEVACKQGVGDLYQYALKRFGRLFEGTRTTRSNVSLVAAVSGRRNAVINLIPQDSSHDRGLAFQVYAYRITERFSMTLESLKNALPNGTESWEYYRGAPDEYQGFSGWFRAETDINRLADAIETVNNRAASLGSGSSVSRQTSDATADR